MEISRISLRQMLCCLAMTMFIMGVQAQEEMSKKVDSQNFKNLEWSPCPSPLDFEGCHITVLNGDPAKANSDILFRMQPGTTAPEHWHNSAERMVLISGKMAVTYEGEETKTMTSGTYAYGPAQKPHKAECIGDEPCVLFIAFEKPVDTQLVNQK
ncbi:cupin domain-containing protein [Robertkochia aurantiaca]|uniref:cupin domain-containing protein n=1 Tax=Robertkochia aurantiaca TaxID=2873700 RepID=UPI001CD01C8E|nr:cupin domain-containing protein [Robertkochia sp. 3YJGBD-33]